MRRLAEFSYFSLSSPKDLSFLEPSVGRVMISSRGARWPTPSVTWEWSSVLQCFLRLVLLPLTLDLLLDWLVFRLSLLNRWSFGFWRGLVRAPCDTSTDESSLVLLPILLLWNNTFLLVKDSSIEAIRVSSLRLLVGVSGLLPNTLSLHGLGTSIMGEEWRMDLLLPLWGK